MVVSTGFFQLANFVAKCPYTLQLLGTVCKYYVYFSGWNTAVHAYDRACCLGHVQYLLLVESEKCTACVTCMLPGTHAALAASCDKCNSPF